MGSDWSPPRACERDLCTSYRALNDGKSMCYGRRPVGHEPAPPWQFRHPSRARPRGRASFRVSARDPVTAASRTHGPYRSSVVRGKALTVARWIGRGTFKAAALIGALFLIVALWLWDASILTRAADQNLQLIKAATRVLPPDWAGKTESALRIFGADRALLLVEGVAVAKLIMLGIAQPFRRRRP
jgi:hypothetical protein